MKSPQRASTLYLVDDTSKAAFALPFQLIAIACLWFGAVTLNEPVSSGGAFNMDVHVPMGAFSALLGILVLELTVAHADLYREEICALAALAAWIGALTNLVAFPPIEDGAYFLLRYGQDDPRVGDLWPSEPDEHVAACMIGAWAAYLGLAPRSGSSGHRFARMTIAQRALFAVCGVLFATHAFTTFATTTDPIAQVALIVSGLVLSALCARVWRRTEPALLGLTISGTATVMMMLQLILAAWPHMFPAR